MNQFTSTGSNRLINDSLLMASYNCRGLKLGSNISQRYEVEKLLDCSEIVCLQETWLSKQDSGDLNGLQSNFNSVSNSPNDDTAGLLKGRRKEGVAILWHSPWEKWFKRISLYRLGARLECTACCECCAQPAGPLSSTLKTVM